MKLNQVGLWSLFVVSILLGSWIGEHEKSSPNKPSFRQGVISTPKGESWHPPKLFVPQSRSSSQPRHRSNDYWDLGANRSRIRLLLQRSDWACNSTTPKSGKTKTGVRKGESGKQLKLHLQGTWCYEQHGCYDCVLTNRIIFKFMPEYMLIFIIPR